MAVRHFDCGVCLRATRFSFLAVLFFVAFVAALPLSAEESKDKSSEPAAVNATDLIKTVQQSIVVVSFSGRTGAAQGVGTGFVVGADGLIATNLHVIGEARPISVEFRDGRRFPVTTVVATEPAMDLALLKVDAKDLPVLPLGDSSKLEQGQPVIAFGNPHGLKHSVARGVVAGQRSIDGRPMLQLDMAIEPGNSGGPVVDLQGRVLGIVTLKSLERRNLGFAVEVNALKPLIEKPNPVPIDRWVTIGAIDTSEWQPLFGAHWRQRAGRLIVSGRGQGFGGRSLCLYQRPVPESFPIELACFVRVQQADGAAGLVFCSDGENKHYGFYPSSGNVRLSRFDGQDVYSWQVLKEVPTPHFRTGEWNHLKVRIEKDRFLCFVNDELVIESTDRVFSTGKIGVAKFRHTNAEFKAFQVGEKVTPVKPPESVVERIGLLVADIDPQPRPANADLVDKLRGDGETGIGVLRDRARRLEQQAARLRDLAQAVHHRNVQHQLGLLFHSDVDEGDIDLLQAALLISQMDNDELSVDAYQKDFQRLVDQVRATVGEDGSVSDRVAALDDFLFKQLGFHGSRTNYYNRSNSYINEVIDDREGLPISLSVLYLELARRLEIKAEGIGLPGHFIVRIALGDDDKQLVDVFDRGKRLSRKEANEKVLATTGQPLQDEHLEPFTKAEIAVRMLRNLFGLADRRGDSESMLRYTEAVLAILPDSPGDRWIHAVLCFQAMRYEEAKVNVAWLIERHPEGIDLNRVQQLRSLLEQVAP